MLFDYWQLPIEGQGLCHHLNRFFSNNRNEIDKFLVTKRMYLQDIEEKEVKRLVYNLALSFLLKTYTSNTFIILRNVKYGLIK